MQQDKFLMDARNYQDSTKVHAPVSTRELDHLVFTYLRRNILHLYIVQSELVQITSHIQGVELEEAGGSDPCTAVYHSHVYQELLPSLI